jgi:glycine/D-amino acid oxidase-like deaminating enzyme
MEICSPRNKTNLYQILRNVAENYPRHGLMVLLSDLLVEREGLFKGLRLLRSRGHDIIVFHVLDDDELDFPFTGPTRFEGLESADQLRCNPRALREGYLEALGAYLEEVRLGCSRHQADYVQLRTSQPLDAALAAFLSNRLGKQRK